MRIPILVFLVECERSRIKGTQKLHPSRVAFLSLPNFVPMSFSHYAILDCQFQSDIVSMLIARANHVLANLESEMRYVVGNIVLEQYWNDRSCPNVGSARGPRSSQLGKRD